MLISFLLSKFHVLYPNWAHISLTINTIGGVVLFFICNYQASRVFKANVEDTQNTHFEELQILFAALCFLVFGIVGILVARVTGPLFRRFASTE